MNSDQLEGKYKQIKGDYKQKYAKLTDDEWEYTEGGFDKVIGKIQEKYGKTKDEIKREISEW
ncbi:CsbD family protein [Aegicerativicinus sediminis]